MILETVIYEKRADGVAVLTLNRPHAGNSINARLDEEVAWVWDDVKEDENVKVVIITGAGDRFFCSGADMKEWSVTKKVPMMRTANGKGFRMLARDHHVYKPIICAINGVCAGGGLHFVNDGDIVICAEDAVFMDPHVSVGQVSTEEPIALSRRVPFEFVMRLALMGVHEKIPAARAHQVGLVSELVPSAKLMERALEIAGTLTRNSLEAMMKTKQAMLEGYELGLTAALNRGYAILASHWSHPDSVEGPSAFAEKREPKWGR